MAGESEGAIVDFSAALGIEPNSAAAHFRRGEAYVARGERDRAIADFDAAIAIEPTSAVAFHARGDAYRSAAAYDRAVTDYSKAIRLDAKFEAAYLHRAEALIAKHDFDGALADLDRVVELDPNNANTRNIRGFVYNSKGEFQTAIADHTAAITIEPLDAYRYSVRAWTYFKAGKTELALADAERAVRFAPYAASVYATRGLILEALRRNERAIADLQKALAVAPSIEEAREALIRLGATAPDPTPPRHAAAPSAVPSAFDEMTWLNGKLDRDTLSKAVFVRDDTAEIRGGPANAFPLIATARGNDRLSATARLEYKTKSGCGIDGASTDAAWLKVRLADGREGYVKSSEVVNDEQRQLLSQRTVLVRTAVDYYQKNNGPLQDFAGIYDGLKDCKAESDDSRLNDAIMREMIFAGLMVKQLIWFEGDTMVSVRFLNPHKPLRGRLTFWRDFELAEGGAIKLYQIRYENGNSERIGFYRDMLIIDPKITGNSINYQYAKRCSQETAMIEWAKRIYDVEVAAKGD